MRLLPEKENYFKEVKNLVEKVNNETKDLKPHCVLSVVMDDSREERSQSLQFIFTIKNTEAKSEKKFSVGMYLFQNKNGVTTFILNGRTLKLLFENSTVNSYTIALHYLNDILLNEVKWVSKLECKLESKKKHNNKNNYQKKPKNNTNYKSGGYKPRTNNNQRGSNNKRNDRNNNRNNGQDNYRKSDSNQRNNRTNTKKKYGNQGTGKIRTGGFKGSTGEGRLSYNAFSNIDKTFPNIKTSKNPYKN